MVSSSHGLIHISPLYHRIQNRLQGLSQLTERVFHPGRNLRVHGTGDQPVLLHGAEAVSENLLADAFQVFLQFIEAPGALQQISNNQQFPFTSNQSDGGCHRTFG